MKLTRRTRRWLIIVTAVFVLYTVIGFFVAPPVVRAQAEKRLSALLDRKVSIAKVRLNPYALSATVEGFDIRERDPAASFVGWNRLYANFDAVASLTGDWVLSDVQLDGFHAAVAVNADHTFNFSDVLAKLAPPANPSVASGPPEKPPRPVRVTRLGVADTRIEFRDASLKEPFATTIGPLRFTLSEFRTVGDPHAPYRFDAVTEAGEKLAWRGTLSADPVASAGEFAVDGVVIKKYAPYLEAFFRGGVNDGQVSVHGRYEAAFASEKRVLRLIDGALQLRNLQVTEARGGEPVIALPAVEVTGIEADAVGLKGNIARVAVSGGKIAVRREKDGGLNLLALLAPAKSPPAKTSETTALPDVTVGDVAVQDFAIDVSDLTTPRAANLALSQVMFSLKNFSLHENATMPMELALAWAPNGSVHSAGTVVVKPEIRAELKTEVAGLDLLPLSPYLEQFVAAQLKSGAFSTAHTVKLTLPASGPAIEFAGDLTVENLAVVDAARNEDLAGVGGVVLTGLNVVTTSPQAVLSLSELKIDAPYGRAILNSDQSLNVVELLPHADAPTAKSDTPRPEAAEPAPAPKIEVGRIVINAGDFSFTDRSIEPNVHTALTKFGGTIAGLSSENGTRADVDLHGTVDDTGPITITGKVEPLGEKLYADLKVDFKNIDLVPLSPYSGKFAGYEIARGKLVLDTKMVIDERKVDGTNVITLHQFTFGGATGSKDATTLPVRLGVALLKDKDGRIVMDLPVQGSFDDPEFQYRKVMWHGVSNLLAKAATSPFTLLGSMFGGGGDELSFQEFAPGMAELQAAEQPKLETMTKALLNRPGLSVALEGGYDPATDSYQLKRQKLAEVVRRRVWADQHQATPDLPPPAQLTVSPEDFAATVKTLFEEKFPAGTQFGTPLPAAPAAAAPPPEAKPGWWKRFTQFVTGSERRAQREREAETARRDAEYAKAVAAAKTTGLPLEEMIGRLAEAIPIEEKDLRALASARAQKVRDYFITTGQIPAERLILAEGENKASSAKGPRVLLSLQ